MVNDGRRVLGGDHQQQLGGSFVRNEGMEILHGYLVGGFNPFEKY